MGLYHTTIIQRVERVHDGGREASPHADLLLSRLGAVRILPEARPVPDLPTAANSRLSTGWCGRSTLLQTASSTRARAPAARQFSPFRNETSKWPSLACHAWAARENGARHIIYEATSGNK